MDEHPELPVDPDPAPARPAHRRPLLLAVVAAGGVLGTAVRYGVAEAVPAPAGGWPTATFAVNLVGSVLLGVLLEGLARAGADSGWRLQVRLLAGTGFCGALTTYSTLAVEVDLLARGSRPALAAGYALASVLLGLAGAAAGIAAAAGGHRLRDRRTAALPVDPDGVR